MNTNNNHRTPLFACPDLEDTCLLEDGRPFSVTFKDRNTGARAEVTFHALEYALEALQAAQERHQAMQARAALEAEWEAQEAAWERTQKHLLGVA